MKLTRKLADRLEAKIGKAQDKLEEAALAFAEAAYEATDTMHDILNENEPVLADGEEEEDNS